MDSEPLDTARPAEAVDHAPLYISLYVVVLAFFILLNTMSTYEQQKADEVLRSIERTFAFRKPIELEFDEPDSEPVGGATSSFLNAIESHAQRFIPLETVSIDKGGDYIELRIPLRTVFDPVAEEEGKLRFNPVNLNVLEGFAQAYAQESGAVRIRLDISVDTQPISLLEVMGSDADAHSVAQAGMLARYFAKAGMPARDMTVGLRQHEAQVARFRFTTSLLPEASQAEGGGA